MKRYFRLMPLLAVLLFGNTEGFSQSMTISYPATQTYTVGTAITALSPAMSGGPASSLGQTTQTLAGSGGQGYANGTGTAASFYLPTCLVADAEGNVYVGDSENNVIRKITPAGLTTTYAGTGLVGSTDGAALSASFRHPAGLAIDALGNIYVSDQYNHKIRKITPAGVVSTVAGTGSAGSVNGTGSAASFNNPTGLVFDSSGNLFVADYYNNLIRKITPAGVVTTFAGSGTAGFANGTGTAAVFNGPIGIAIDGANNLYIADRLSYRVRKITPAAVVTTLAGSGTSGSTNATGTSASFNRPTGIAIDVLGNLYVTDENNLQIRKVTPAGVVSAYAGTVGFSGTVNGTGSAATFYSPYAITIDKQGNLYVAQLLNHVIRKVVTTGYNIYPNLPAGLIFNNSTGVISGTPTVAQSSKTYYIQAFNATHSSNVATLDIAVAAAASAILPSQDQNYIITYTPRTELLTEAAVIAATSDRDKVQANIQYFDGLGRPLQNVEWKGSPNKRDLVTPIAYDAFGREDKKYLPYSATVATSNGSYKVAAITDQNSFYTTPGTTAGWASGGVVPTPGAAFSRTIFEASPLNRVLEQGAPGAVWQPGASRTATAGRTVVMDYGTNNAVTAYTTATGFAVRLYSATASTVVGSEHLRTLGGTAYYLANQLYLTVSKDENWLPADVKLGTVEEYKDKEGRVVLKRTFNKVGTTIQTLSTYYVYDDLGNLSFVLPPGANPDAITVPTQTVLDNFCYQYRYDGRQRLIQKKLPGKGWEQLIYNKLDQVVFTQDSVQAAAATPGPYRSFVKYDAFGRVIMTGVEKGHTGTRKEIQNVFDTWNEIVLSEKRDAAGWHGYTIVSVPGNTATMEAQVVNYYDDYAVPGIPNNQSANYSDKLKGLLTASKTLVLGTTTYLWTVNYYNDEGRIVRVWEQHYKGGAVAPNSYDETTNTYNNITGELTSSIRRHFVAGVEKLHVINDYLYDHMGRLKDTYQNTADVAPAAGTKVLLSRNTYNEVGQLSSKGLHSTNLITPAFAQTVTYSYNARGWLKNQSAPLFSEGLKYEDIITNVTSQYNGNISRQEWGPSATPALHNYTYTYDRLNRLTTANSDENHNEQLGYDLMGNITRLQRKKTNVLEDQLKYTYSGNKLTSVLDSTASVNAAFQLQGTTSYTYNVNGNMLTRSNTANTGNNLSAITYNHLNLPSTLTAGTAAIVYTYDAAGNKLRKQVASASINNEYISGIHYEGDVLKFMSTAEGRVVRNGATSYSYEYTLEDHLGNGRVYFDISGGVARKIQEVDYYAFGLDIQRSLIGTENKYQYNGKEKQDQEKMFDYGARFYDPVVARFTTVDPSADEEDQETDSPYGYVANNPISRIDKDGKIWGQIIGAVVGAAVDYGTQVATNYANGKSGTDAWKNNINLVSIGTAAVEGALTNGGSAVKSLGAKVALKAGAALVNNIVEVKTSSKGLKSEVQTNVGTIVKNAGIDLAVDGLISGLAPSGKTVQKVTGINKGNVAKAVKSGLKSVGVDVTRAVNNGVKAGSKAAVNVTSDGARTIVQKATTNSTKDNFKKKTD